MQNLSDSKDKIFANMGCLPIWHGTHDMNNCASLGIFMHQGCRTGYQKIAVKAYATKP